MSNSSPPHPPPPPLHHISSFLKIPRIRLRKGSTSSSNSSSSSNKGHAYHDNNNKFNTGHLVNTTAVVQLHISDGEGGAPPPTHRSTGNNHLHQLNNHIMMMGDHHHEEDTVAKQRMIIKPKKLPNPIKDSQAMQNIHKELLLNQKIGRSVLTHKTELQKAIEKLAANKQGCEDLSPTASSTSPPPPELLLHHHHQNHVQNSNITSKATEFQRVLNARAKLIEEQKCFVDGESKRDITQESEFEKIHKRVTSKQIQQ